MERRECVAVRVPAPGAGATVAATGGGAQTPAAEREGGETFYF